MSKICMIILKSLFVISHCLLTACGDDDKRAMVTENNDIAAEGKKDIDTRHNSGDRTGSKKNNDTGNNNGGSTGGKQESDNGRVFAACTVTGNLANFKVKCSKEIRDLSIGVVTMKGENLFLSDNGKTTKIMKTNASTVTGSAIGHTKLEFIVNHTDGSSSTISVNGTGSKENKGTGNKKGKNDSHREVFKPCVLTGNMAHFEVKCPKEIRNIRANSPMGPVTLAKLSISWPNGKTTKIEKKDPHTLIGNATGHTKLEFTIIHTDGTTSYITVN